MKKIRYTVKEDIDTDAIVDAIAAEKKKIFENISDERTEFKKERKTTLTIHYKPNPDTRTVTISADIQSTLAPQALLAASEIASQISFDDINEEDGEVTTWS